MASDPRPSDAQPNDLFGRWLAHHEQQAADQDGSEGEPEKPARPAPAPRTSRRLPAAAVASSAVESDPFIGGRIAPPSTFGARRPNPSACRRAASPSPSWTASRRPAGSRS